MTWCYKGRTLKKHCIPDLIVYSSLVVELKAVSQLLPEHEAQLINYLRIAQHPVGYSSISAIKELWSGNALSCLSSSHNKVVKISVD